MLLALLGAAIATSLDSLPICPISPHSYGAWTSSGSAFRVGPASGRQLVDLEIRRNLDEAVFCSEQEGDGPVGKLTSAEFTIARRFITFRIGGGDYPGRTCMNLLVGGKVVRTVTGHRSDTLASDKWDVSNYRGSKASIEIVDLESGDWGHINVDHITQTNRPEPGIQDQPLYHEALRPQFHVTARYWNDKRTNPVEHQEGWINDLNGLIYYDGEYHMFAQRWATCWLHLVSRDLVHWQELQPAFFEESLGSGVQSGTCVIDYANTSGLATDPKHPAIVAFWSRFDNRSQCLHYSLDHGRTWKPYAKNPFMSKPERDPKVFWYAPGSHWVMVMYGEGSYHILNSANLTDWTDTGHSIPDSFECPDVFELPIDGDKTKTKWVVVQGSGNYSIGDFDGQEFIEESPRLVCDIGPNFYATQSWANTETGDGRRIQAAWMRGSVFPNMPFSQQVSFPCQLTLRTTSAGIRLCREPVAEIEKLHSSAKNWDSLNLKPGDQVSLTETGDCWRLRCRAYIPKGAKLLVNLRGQTVEIGEHTLESGLAHGELADPVRDIEILLDRGSIETFLNHGELSSTRFEIPEGKGISVSSEGGEVRLVDVELNGIKSIWH